MLYYIRYQGKKEGPIPESHLVTLLERGTVTKETEASIDEVQWKPLGEFPEFKRFCSQVIARQFESGRHSGTAPAPGGLGLPLPPRPPDKSDPQSNALLKPFAVEIKPRWSKPRRSKSTSFKSGKKDRSTLLAGLGSAAGLLLILVVLLAVFFETDRSGAPKTGLAKKQEASSKPAEEPPRDPAVEKPKKKRDGTGNSAAGRESPKNSGPETKPDNAPSPPPAAAPEPPAPPKDPTSRSAPAVSSLPSVFPVKPLAGNAFGEVALSSSTEPVSASLYPRRQHILLRYVSYVPGSVFVAKNSSPHELRVFHNGNAVLRLALEKNGLNAAWLGSPGLSTTTYQTINGALLAELEILQESTGQTLKSLALIGPVETGAFKSVKKQEVSIPRFACDFPSLGLAGANLSVADAKGYRPLYEWASTSDDTLHFKVENGYHAEIQVVPQTPAVDNGDLDIPIVLDLIGRDCPLLDRYARETSTSPDQLDQKLEKGNKATSQARTEMLRLRRLFNRNNSTINKANASINVLNRRLPYAVGVAATDITNRISRQRSIIAARRNDNKQLMPELQLAEARYDDYLGKLRVFRNYKALFDKPAIIYRTEPITFSIHLAHPDDRNRTLLLLSMKTPDMSTESNAIMPPMPTDDEDDDEEKEEEEEEEDDMAE